MEKKKLSKYLIPITELTGETSNWFGYYNYDPLDTTHKRLLCNRADFDGRAITSEDSIELGWMDVESGEWNHIDRTRAFNWQQGAMLQWMPHDSDLVVYNSENSEHYVSYIYNVKTREKRTIDWPIYAIAPNGKRAFSLNYERCYWCRAYHYKPIVNEKYNVNVPDEDGIYEIDLENNTRKLVVDIHDVIATDKDENFSEKKHWLEHIMLNREGTKMVFLHRFSGEDVFRYTTRVCICDTDGKNLQVISGWRNNDWSHVGWKSENEFVVFTVRKGAVASNSAPKTRGGLYMYAKKIYKKFLSPILGKTITSKLESSHEYQLYEIIGNAAVKKDTYSGNIGAIDGHPSFTVDGGIMITDTYQDTSNYQHLQAYNPTTKKMLELGSFFATFSGNPASCDLHPKLSRDNEYVMVDTAYSGKHTLVLFKLDWSAIKSDLE